MVTKRRVLQLSSDSVAGANELVVEIQQAEVGPLALEVGLLVSRLVESLHLRSRAGPSLTLSLINDDRLPKAIVTHQPDGARSFAVGINQTEYLQAVLLRAFRDGAAEVNHIHIEGQRDGEPFDLTLMFELYKEPMSEGEAAVRLRD